MNGAEIKIMTSAGSKSSYCSTMSGNNEDVVYEDGGIVYKQEKQYNNIEKLMFSHTSI